MDSYKLPGHPVLIEHSQHGIVPANVSPAALETLATLNNAGFKAYLVGGAVRDLLIGRTPKDFDVATNAEPQQIRRLFRRCRIIGRRFQLAHVLFGRDLIEVATFRGNSSDGDRELVNGRLIRDNVWGNIEEDAKRRDFRVNALYYDISRDILIDYVGGMDDIAKRTLQLIGDPERRFREDPVRMLRAARLAAKLDFSIAGDARMPIPKLARLLVEAAPARLFDELLKLFMAGFALASYRSLMELELLPVLFPQVTRQLRDRKHPWFEAMLEHALVNTDARVNSGGRVTPAFLLAVLLWPDVMDQAQKRLALKDPVAIAWQKASRQVISEQARRMAIPKRFALFMEDVWMLQPRLEQKRTRKRVMRILQHPRFRAAYDFLLLREGASVTLAQLGQWWTRAQTLSAEDLVAEFEINPHKRSPKAGKRHKHNSSKRQGSIQEVDDK